MFSALAQRALHLPEDRILQSVASSPSSKHRFTWLASVSLGPANHYSTLALLCKQEGTIPASECGPTIARFSNAMS